MNYLAHLYLSADRPLLAIGNFIADHVKGSMADQYDGEVRDGIRLHRMIDEFTDSHPIVEKSKARLRPDFRKYAPVIVDLY
jgi:acyl carrier protein phosphodiesterase